jgi:hypothetical protein
MHRTSTPQVRDERVAAFRALLADPSRPSRRSKIGVLADLSARELVELFSSSTTAKSRVSRILGKLRSKNRFQAAVYAARCGLV